VNRARKPETQYPLMSPTAFAAYGGGAVGYVRAMRSEDVASLYPQAPPLIPGLTVFVLHAADGTPLSITDSFDEIVRAADSHALETMSVH
jgi:hypothetical protein